jgi:hypothetical protein
MGGQKRGKWMMRREIAGDKQGIQSVSKRVIGALHKRTQMDEELQQWLAHGQGTLNHSSPGWCEKSHTHRHVHTHIHIKEDII